MDDIRSFMAIEIPSPLKARMEEIQRQLRRTDADVKWVRPEAIHLTLKFLGSIRQEDVERISQALAPVVAEGESFEVRVQGMGCFPNPRNPRVVWLGVDRGKDALASLQGAIEKKMAELSFLPEDRPFSPHLTMGRVRSPRGRAGLAQVLEKHQGVEIGIFQTQEVILFRSELRPSGAVYTKLREFPFLKR
jgi:RNA 2',3'-cyclic 3'-phosphodiesterase